jgi:hypothetical protein
MIKIAEFGKPTLQHRNYRIEAARQKPVNSEVTVRPITEEELKKFQFFKRECKEGKRWTERD